MESFAHGEGEQLTILVQLKENVRDIMRSPEKVLNSLTEHSHDSNYKFERLYRILFNEEMYHVAYQRIYAKEGNMTKGTDGKTISQMSISRIEKVIASLKDESYQPQPARRTYIPKKNGKLRPLGIPSSDDKIVQEVIRMVLEAIYEGKFENTSHGFRPKRSCHTALIQIQNRFTATKWFIEGDIEGFFDNINHDILIEILKEHISDERFIRLIRKFLKAGYLEDWKFHRTFSGTPQGGIISPILANIYLDKLDNYVKEYAEKFNKGIRRKVNPEYSKLTQRIRCLKKKLKANPDETSKMILIEKINQLQSERNMPSVNEMDDGFKRVTYVRYADDFLIGVIGSKQDGELLKENIKNFLFENLKLTLSNEKTLITHANSHAKFLGYEIYVRKFSTETKRSVKTGRLSRVYGRKVVMKVPIETIRKKLIEYEAMEITKENGKEKWNAKSRGLLINDSDLKILDTYNSEVRGFTNYYLIANNSSYLHRFKYIMQYSMYKTFAQKYSTSMRKIIAKYRNHKDFAVSYENNKGEKKMRIFFNGSFKRIHTANKYVNDSIPNFRFIAPKTNMIGRLKERQCELCGKEDNLVMHQVRKLKDLKGDEPWKIKMNAIHRKSLAVCQSCLTEILRSKQTDIVNGEPDTSRGVSPVRRRALGNLP